MYKLSCGIFAIGLFFLQPAQGQPADNAPVTREEFEQLKKDNAEMKKALAEIRKAQTEQATNADQDAKDNETAMKAINDKINKARPGLEGFVFAGDGAVGFTTQQKSHSSFNADVSPLILWQPPDPHFLIEFAFDLEIGGEDINSESTSANLELANISYTFCDYFVVGGGLFSVPFGQFHHHFDPPWINKYPDNPLAFDALAPESEVGFWAQGVIPSGTTKWTYDVYAVNGPNLVTNDPEAAGQLNFSDYTDLNNNKAIGGRIGFIPFPEMEIGYSIQYSKPGAKGFTDVSATMQAADFHWKPLVHSLKGQFDVAAEWIWTDISSATYDPTGSLGFGPDKFGNFSQGGYASVAYRPTEVDSKVLRDLEFLARYDSLQTPLGSPGGQHESRWTFGVDYWLTPYVAIKTAYEFDNRKFGPGQNAFMFQVGFGL